MISLEERLIRHELIGLGVTIIRSVNPLHLGIKGMVVDETRNMLVIASNQGKKFIPKADATYGFTLNGTSVEVNGNRLLGRSVDRIGRASRSRFI